VPDANPRPPIRSRTPRAEGKARILDATIELLRESGPDGVNVRQIAKRSGHNQRFVIEWFSSKVDLFAEAFERLAQDFAQSAAVFVQRRELEPDLVLIVRLMNWLVANGSTEFRATARRPILDLVAEQYRERFSLDDRTADLLAQRFVGATVSMILFGDVLGLAIDDLDDHISLDIEIAQLLGQNRNAP